MNNGSRGSQYHCQKPPDCASTIFPRFRLPADISTPTNAKPMAISYETICAAERRLPRNAYLELEAQPAMMTPYTPIEVMARIYSRPASIFASIKFRSNGTTAQAARAGAMASTGPRKKRNLFDAVG